MSEETGKRIGDYQILNELGSGGMGRVWRVRNLITERIEAMKVLLPDLAGRHDLAERFQREIKLMASLDHPNIAGLRTAFTADNQLVMVMEYVEGTDLAARLHHGPIPVPEAVNYIGQVLSALSYAHQQNVIHRDIKPSNMMLTPQGVIKLMDFGIARAGAERSLTMTGTTLGSLSYMSPEQVRAEATDARSDLYSVGVSLYEMVTGQRPFQASSDYSIMAAHVKETPKPPVELQPGLPAALNDIILMAIAKEPAKRFQTADAFRNALSSVATPAAGTVRSDEAATVDSILPPVVLQPTPAAIPVRPVATPVAPNAAVPIAAPVPMPPPGGHRGLYMTLGALIVLGVLVAAGIYLPRSGKTSAGISAASPAAQSEAQPSQAPAVVPAGSSDWPEQPAAPAGTTLAAGREVEKSSSAIHGKKPTAKNDGSGNAASPNDAGGAGSQEASVQDTAAQLDELEQEVDQLSNRAAAANSSLDHLQQQQGAAGYGLRSDMAAKQASMMTNLSKAGEAVQHGDVTRAKKFVKLAEGDVEALEKFLGH